MGTTMTPNPLDGLDIEGPVQAEIFVLMHVDAGIALTGPCGPAPWLVELGAGEHPVEVVERMVRQVLGPPRLVHSTSWRREREAVLLTFVVVVDPELAAGFASVPLCRVELARSTTTAAPAAIAHAQVVEHGMRHLAWLVADDPIVAPTLSPRWRSALAGYVPEPFRNLG